jgi:asparagine synthase (glutamine-hydrolysing)
MPSASGRFIMTYNGEIYNHTALRGQLEQEGLVSEWRGTSDTETLLAAIEAWGLDEALSRTHGMFALALWDRETRKLTLARDRLGEKPLYYGWQEANGKRAFLFGSDLSALRQHPAWQGVIDRGALALYFRHLAVPAPYSIFENIRKLEPGTIATLSFANDEPVYRAYWSAMDRIETMRRRPFSGSPDEAVSQLEKLAGDAVARQMIADVPLGAFLSGGIDSSTIVALMQARSDRPVRTFTIGFDEHGFDEAVHAKAVAKHLGTDHTELYLDPQDVLDVVGDLPRIYSEPFADSSQIPTFLVSRLARGSVTVALSGDAGDELFGGYNRYAFTQRLWGKIGAVPGPLRDATASLLEFMRPAALGRAIGKLPSAGRFSRSGEVVAKGAPLLRARSSEDLYLRMVSAWRDPAALVIGGAEHTTWLTGKGTLPADLDTVERMMATDLVTYLPDDILTKVDRAAMAVSLETRVPFLDHDVVEFAWSLPQEYKMRREGGRVVTKWVLRQLLDRYVPRTLIDRPKMGFGVPVAQWLRGPLRDWASSLLDPALLRRQGLLNAECVERIWREHSTGRRDWHTQLWAVLMFQVWLVSFDGGGLDAG